MAWRCTIPLFQQRFRTFYPQVSKSITSMFHDTCHKWQTDSKLCSQLYRRVKGHRWGDGERERGNTQHRKKRPWGAGQCKDNAGRIALRRSCRARSLSAGTRKIHFHKTIMHCFFSVCARSNIKCLSWHGGSGANWHIDCDKYVVVWMVVVGVSAEKQTHSI